LTASLLRTKKHSKKFWLNRVWSKNSKFTAARCSLIGTYKTQLADCTNDGQQHVASLQMRALHVWAIEGFFRDVIRRCTINEETSDYVLPPEVWNTFFNEIIAYSKVVSVRYSYQ
jgi:hypothetical protein